MSNYHDRMFPQDAHEPGPSTEDFQAQHIADLEQQLAERGSEIAEKDERIQLLEILRKHLHTTI